MKRICLSLWHDERAFVQSAELVLIATVAVLSMVVGLATYRDAVVAELNDTAQAVGAINQSYTMSIQPNGIADSTLGVSITVSGDTVSVDRTFNDTGAVVRVHSTFRNYAFQDTTDFCDTGAIVHLTAVGADEQDTAAVGAP